MMRSERGSILVLVSILSTALLGMAVLAVDGAFLAEVRSEVRNTVDTTALVAASGLAVNRVEALDRAQQYTLLNPVLGQSVDLGQQEVVFGVWNADRQEFFPTTSAANSVQVTVRLSEDTQPSSPALFFGPILGRETVPVSETATASLGSRSVLLSLDNSGSMQDDTQPGQPEQPLTDTKAAAKKFLGLLQDFPISGDRVGLVYYSNDATLVHELTESYGDVQDAIDGPDADACTNIAAALCVARREVLSERGAARGVKVIVLLSDGRTNTLINPGTCALKNGSICAFVGEEFGVTNEAAGQASDQADRIAEDGIILYTISLGTETNPLLMEQMAQKTGGEHFFSPTTDDLEDVFTQISARIPVALVE